MNAPDALGAFRGCDAHDRDHGISYIAVMEWTGPDAVAAALAAAEAAGMRCALRDEAADYDHRHCYATLDYIDENGDISDGECIPTREAFDWWVRAVELRCQSSDCPVDTPEAHAATREFVDVATAGDYRSAAEIQLALVRGGGR